MTQKYHKVAVFAGSFSPFTLGHADVVKRALAMGFDVHICVGVNVRKEGDLDAAEQRAQHIRSLWRNCPAVTVATWSGLTAQYAAEVGADCLLRSVRSAKDYEYERDMADYHLTRYGLDTILFMARPQLSFVSSSLVRELQAFGESADDMLPTPDDCNL